MSDAETVPAGLCFELSGAQQALRERVREFVERACPKPVARALEAAEEFPRSLVEALREAGLYGIGVDERYGGAGGDVLDQVIVCEELSRSLAGLSVVWHLNAWSGGKALRRFGTEAQRSALLPALAEGRLLFAFALTEAGGGTDVLSALRTRASPVDGGFVIDGTKTWSTLAHVADKILVLARTATGAKPSEGLTMFMVDRRAAGLSTTPIPKLGLRSLGSCEVAFDGVFAGDDAVLGEVGAGWRQIVSSLNSERIMTAAMCTGMLAGVLEDAVAYAAHGPAGATQAAQHGLADIAMNLASARLHTYRAAWLERAGRPCGVEATTAKCLASEYAVEAADFGIQLLGDAGYSTERDMQRYWRDARLFRIGPISNEMARNHVGESLGLPRSF